MAKTPRKSPGVGRQGDNLASQAAYRAALAVEILDKEKIAAANEIRKRHRKGHEKNGVVLADLDDLYKMRDMAFSEIVIWFKRKFNALGAVFDLGTQFDLFTPTKAGKLDLAAFRQAGMMAGLHHKDRDPPPGLAGEEMNVWLAGYDEGYEARLAAWQAQQEEEAEARAKAKEASGPPAGDDTED